MTQFLVLTFKAIIVKSPQLRNNMMIHIWWLYSLQRGHGVVNRSACVTSNKSWIGFWINEFFLNKSLIGFLNRSTCVTSNKSLIGFSSRFLEITPLHRMIKSDRVHLRSITNRNPPRRTKKFFQFHYHSKTRECGNIWRSDPKENFPGIPTAMSSFKLSVEFQPKFILTVIVMLLNRD